MIIPFLSIPVISFRLYTGTTKEFVEYPGFQIEGRHIQLLDTPGVGDEGVTVMKLLTLLEHSLLKLTACSSRLLSTNLLPASGLR